MENKIVFTAEENGFTIEADGKKLRVSYAEFCGKHKDAMEFCKEWGGGDETVENLRFIARYRDVINEELMKFSRELPSRWYWTNELAWRSGGRAFVVSTLTGNVYGEDHNHSTYARAVSAL